MSLFPTLLVNQRLVTEQWRGEVGLEVEREEERTEEEEEKP